MTTPADQSGNSTCAICFAPFPRHLSAGHAHVVSGLNQSGWTPSEEEVEAGRRELELIHWDGSGCGDNGTGACSNCFGPSPMSAREVSETVLTAARDVLESDAVRETSDGQANDCTHMSSTGIDAAPIGPGKVWRCDHCGLSWTDSGPRFAASSDAVREVERLRGWKAEAMEVMSGLQEVGNALGVPLGHQITARNTVDTALDLRNQRDDLKAEVELLRMGVRHQEGLTAHGWRDARTAESERDELARVVAEVRAGIVAALEGDYHDSMSIEDYLRTILDAAPVVAERDGEQRG